MNAKLFHKPILAAAAVLAIGFTACAGASTSSPPPTPFALGEFRSAPQPAGPVFHAFTAGTTPGFLSTATAWDIAPANAHAMWFTDGGTPAIGTITSSGTVQEYTTGLASGSRPYSIVTDPTGNGWFSDQGNASLGRITPSGTITEYTDPKLSGTYPQGITIAADGTPWFISVGPTSYFVHATSAGVLTLTSIPSTLSPDGSLLADAAGNLWFVATGTGGKAQIIERRADGSLVHNKTVLEPAVEPCCPNLSPKRLVVGPDGNLWLTTLNYVRPNGNGSNLLATLTLTGVKYVKVPNGSINYAVYTSGITRLGDKIWIAGDDPFQLNGGLWSMSTGGVFTSYPIAYNPVAISKGTGGNLWITSHFGGQASQIVQVVLS